MPVPDSEFTAVAQSAASIAGEIVAKYFADLSTAAIEDKQQKTDGDSHQGLVTRADIEAEQAIIAAIRARFPDHAFVAEEEHTSGAADAEHLWVIDPLDGTNNFAHGIEQFGVSIAYIQCGVAESGCVFNPARDDWYVTEKGRGAWRNGKAVQVNAHQSLDQTIVACGFHYDRGALMAATLECIRDLFHADVQGIRRMGSAALDLVAVGCGQFGAYFEYALSPWDFAAGKLFVEEAGGRISTCVGSDPKLEKTSMLASNGLLHESVLKIVESHADY